MKLFEVWRTDTVGYDQYDSWMVIASNASEAKNLIAKLYAEKQYYSDSFSNIYKLENLKAKEITITGKAKVIHESFNAG